MKNKTRKHIQAYSSLALIVSLSNTTLADEFSKLGSEMDMFSDFSVTSATRLAQSPRDLPVSVTIIDKKMIQASGATEIPDLLRIVPGFRVAQPDGGVYLVFGHGSSLGSGRNLEVLIDGLPVQSPLVNLVDWLALPIEVNDIEYIEIMRGTSVAVYGSNAFDGAINIVTKKPFEEQGAYYQVALGDDNQRKYQVKYGFTTNDSSHTISAVYKNNSGYENIADDNNNKKLTYKGNYSPSVSDEIDVLLSINDGFKDNEDNSGRKRPRKSDNNSQYVHWRHKYNREEELILKAYHHYVEYDNTYNLGLISALYGISPALVPILFNGHSDQDLLFATVSAKSDRFGLDLQKNYVYDKLRFVIGAGLVYDDLTSDFVFGDRKNVSGLYRQIFSNLEWHAFDDLIVNYGLMLEKIEDRDEKLSGRFSVNHHININNTLRFAYAKSYRGRTVYSANSSLVSRYAQDGDIFSVISDGSGYDQPEKLTSIELAFLTNLPDYKVNLDFRLFRDRYDDVRKTVYDASYPDDANNGALVSINGGRYEVKGYEIQVKYQPYERWFTTFQYTRADSEGRIINNLSGTTYEDFSDAMPKHSYSFLINAEIYPSVNLGITYSKLSDLNWRSDFYTSAGKLPGYERLDLDLDYRFKLAGENARIELIVQNALDDYKEYLDENIFDTRAILRFTIDN